MIKLILTWHPDQEDPYMVVSGKRYNIVKIEFSKSRGYESLRCWGSRTDLYLETDNFSKDVLEDHLEISGRLHTYIQHSEERFPKHYSNFIRYGESQVIEVFKLRVLK